MSPIVALLLLVLIGTLPGCLLIRLLLRQPCVSIAERLFFGIVASLALNCLFGYGLGIAGMFGAKPLLLLNLVSCIALFSILKIAGVKPPPEKVNLKEWAAIAGIVCLNILLAFLFPLPTWLYGGSDLGPFYYGGVVLAKTGSIRFPEAFLVSLSHAQDFFVGTDYNLGSPITFSGFDYYPGYSLPYHTHMLSAWFGIVNVLFGDTPASHTLFAFGVLGAVAAFFLGKRVGGEAAGLAVSLLLSVNFVQLWSSRYATADITVQCFSLSAACLFLLSYEKGHTRAGLLSGIFWGFSIFLRIDLVAAALPLAILAVLRSAQAKNSFHTRQFGNTLLLLLGFFLIWGVFASPRYFSAHGQFISSRCGLPVELIILAVVTCFLVGFGILNFGRLRRFVGSTFPYRHASRARLAGMAFCCLIACVLAVVGTCSLLFPSSLNRLPLFPFYFLRRVSLVLFGPISALVFLGCALWMRKGTSAARVDLGVSFMCQTLFISFPDTHYPIPIPDGYHTLAYFFMPMSIVMLVSMGSCLFQVTRENWAVNRLTGISKILAQRRSSLLNGAVGLGLAAMMIWSLRGAASMRAPAWFDGVRKTVGEIAGAVGDEVIVLGETWFGRNIGIPLKYGFQKRALMLFEGGEDLGGTLDEILAKGFRVFVMDAYPDHLYHLSRRFSFRCVGMYTMGYPEYDASFERLPGRRMIKTHLPMYEIMPLPGPALEGSVALVAMGENELGSVKGFSTSVSCEIPAGKCGRVSGEAAEIVLPYRKGHGDALLTLVMDCVMPGTLFANISLFMNGIHIGHLSCRPDSSVYEIRVPATALAANNQALKLRIDNYGRRDTGRSYDPSIRDFDRDKRGILLSSVRLEPAM